MSAVIPPPLELISTVKFHQPGQTEEVADAQTKRLVGLHKALRATMSTISSIVCNDGVLVPVQSIIRE